MTCIYEILFLILTLIQDLAKIIEIIFKTKVAVISCLIYLNLRDEFN